MDLTEEQIDQWEAWFRKLDDDAKRDRPPGFYALTDMARKYLKPRDGSLPQNGRT